MHVATTKLISAVRNAPSKQFMCKGETYVMSIISNELFKKLDNKENISLLLLGVDSTNNYELYKLTTDINNLFFIACPVNESRLTKYKSMKVSRETILQLIDSRQTLLINNISCVELSYEEFFAVYTNAYVGNTVSTDDDYIIFSIVAEEKMRYVAIKKVKEISSWKTL